MPEPIPPHLVLGVAQQTVLLLPAPETEEPASVELALLPGVVPGELSLREEILVAGLTVEVLSASECLPPGEG